jgi:hypothetical protein
VQESGSANREGNVKEETERPVTQDRQKWLHDFLTSKDSYPLSQLMPQLHRATDLFLHEIAERVCGPMNDYLRTMPQATLEEKKALAKWLNAQLGAMGLAIRCPKSNSPAFVVADIGDNPRVGRFQLRVSDNGESSRSRTTLSRVELPRLEFTPVHGSGPNVSKWRSFAKRSGRSGLIRR